MVGRDHVAGTGHILNNEFGIARNMLSHVGDDEAGPQVIEVAGWRSDYNLDGFSLVEGGLGLSRAHAPEEQAKERRDDFFHVAHLREIVSRSQLSQLD